MAPGPWNESRSLVGHLDPQELGLRGCREPHGAAWGAMADRVGDDFGISEHAVQRYIAAVFSKLGLPVGAEGHRRVLAVLTYIGAQES
jgi:hypothetical protein